MLPQPLFGRAPKNGMLARIGNFERLLRRQTDQPVVTREPILGKHPDVDVNADRRAGNADGIRAIFQNVRDRHFLLFAG